MFHPNYIYRPMPEEQRKRLSEAHRRRLGNLVGHRSLYGVQVPEAIWPEVSNKRAHRIAAHRKASKDDMRFFVRILIVMVEEGR